MPMIEVANVTAHYGIRPVLRDVSLTVERGELLGVMGPNGMGKSTLLKLIAGAMAPWTATSTSMANGDADLWRRRTPFAG